MSKKPPSVIQMTAIALFVLSCFGLLLYLWLAFGGATPLLAKSYRVEVAFPEATQLASQADVRISGVSVGKVKELDLGEDQARTVATLELDAKHAPIPADSRAVLRSKTLLSEAYVELTPGDPDGRPLADGGRLPNSQVARQIQLDEILRTFDDETRRAFQTWMQSSASGAYGQGLAFNNALGAFQPTFAEFDKLLRELDSQSAAVARIFRDGAKSFRAFGGQPGQLSGMIRNFNTVFQTTAERNRQLEETFIAFPTFLDESRATADRFGEFAVETEPLMRQLTPAATELSGTFVRFSEFAPELRSFVRALAPVIRRSPAAFGAFRKIFRDDFPPLLRDVQPFFHAINPLLDVVDAQKRELTGFLGNTAAALQGNTVNPDGSQPHFLRTIAMLSAEGYATFNERLQYNRTNPYLKPGGYEGLPSGLPSFHTDHCSSGIVAQLDPSTPSDPGFQKRLVEPDEEEAEKLFERIKRYAFNDSDSTAANPAPDCVQQGPYTPYGIDGGPEVLYPQVWNGDARP